MGDRQPIINLTNLNADVEKLSIRSITASETIALRHSVLWPDAPMSYVYLPEDDEGQHFGAFLPSRVSPVAIISIFVEGLPAVAQEIVEDAPPRAVRFRKFACEPSYQGRGFGTALLKHVFSVARTDLESGLVWCDARVESAPWYGRRGMRSFGETFSKGSIPYIRMKIEV